MPATHLDQDANNTLSVPSLVTDEGGHPTVESGGVTTTSTASSSSTTKTMIVTTTTTHDVHHSLSTSTLAPSSPLTLTPSSSSNSIAISSSSSSSSFASTSDSKQACESHVQERTATTVAATTNSTSSLSSQISAHKYTSSSSSSNKLSTLLSPILRQLTPEWKAALLVCLRSYGIGYVFAAAPKLIKTLIGFLTNPRRAAKGQFVLWAFIKALVQVGVEGFSAKRDGMSMLLLLSLGGHRVLELVLTRGMKKAVVHHHHLQQQQKQQKQSLRPKEGAKKVQWQEVELEKDLQQRITTLSSFVSSAIAILFMHRKRPRHATIDYTLFAVVRALDVMGHMAVEKKWGPSWLENYGSVLVFQLACTEIMFAWLYEPERLPGPYAFWITRMSRMDARLLQMLRGIRKGEVLFGPGQSAAQPATQALLTGLCNDLKLPESWGSLDRENLTCSLVHQGIAESCEAHGAFRWFQGFFVSSGIYLPVHLLPALLSPKAFLKRLVEDPVNTSMATLLATARSSAFLATYISLVWYGICMWRSRIMPLVSAITGRRYPGHVVDYVYGPILGSALCGLSVLIEKKHRRAEMALYVLPRALFSLGSRVLQGKLSRRVERMAEALMFALSMSVLLTGMRWEASLVRPSMRGILGWILGGQRSTKSQQQKLEPKKAESAEKDEIATTQ
ncbi:hypothetical protein DFQ26_000510 [Actinomortierella ambigua]|nr:hypothetical protein DFQ26_000510 [Actinomortierella ambigua]